MLLTAAQVLAQDQNWISVKRASPREGASALFLSRTEAYARTKDTPLDIAYSALYAQHAQFLLYDSRQNLLVHLEDLPQVGIVQLESRGLAPGNYKYALAVNGRVVFRRKLKVI
ncbi:MAG TPA: hypothetical protein VGD40_02340 [Chryseosolibacter sp.]